MSKQFLETLLPVGRFCFIFLFQTLYYSAGLGVLKMALQAVSRMTGSDADPHFFLLDKDVLTLIYIKVIVISTVIRLVQISWGMAIDIYVIID